MASRGLCSLGEFEVMTDAARLLFGEEPTEPDLERASTAPRRRQLLAPPWQASAKDDVPGS